MVYKCAVGIMLENAWQQSIFALVMASYTTPPTKACEMEYNWCWINVKEFIKKRRSACVIAN